VADAGPRADYAYPFRISPSGQAAQTGYAAHVEQMVKQVLLTTPGERVDLPDFGCGLRRLVFAPNRTGGAVPSSLVGVTAGDAMTASAQILIRQALDRWLSAYIQVQQVLVLAGDDVPADRPEGEVEVEVRYLLLATQDTAATRVRVF
jgi:phage baseplate assembly protein W